MRTNGRRAGGLLSLLACLALVGAGCGKDEGKDRQAQGGNSGAKGKDDAAKGKPTEVAGNAKGHDHGGWWCDEHGVPEEICGQCSAKAAKEAKAKGDWCAEHDRPDSQCFVCHPEYEARFAAQYEAKYGKKPPKPETEGRAKDEGKK